MENIAKGNWCDCKKQLPYKLISDDQSTDNSIEIVDSIWKV